MEWRVIKLGVEMYDPLHAYGVALTLASASSAPIELRDEGPVYRLYSPITVLPELNTANLLAKILALPTPEQLQLNKQELEKASVALANLDGLLVALFTVPGVRLVSVCDLLDHQRQQPMRSEAGLKKVNQAILRWQKYLECLSKQPARWLALALQDYEITLLTVPFSGYKGNQDLCALMTLDPSFGYSTRRVMSDGLITDKTNITVRGTRFAVLFALIGAARFLRAQRTNNKLVNLYVPVANVMTIHPETAMPLLNSATVSASQAVVYQWLVHSQAAGLPEVNWNGLAYQTLQTQGTSQSISVGRGYLSYQWLNSLKKQVGLKMINYWKLLLDCRPEQLSFELGNLIDALLERHSAAWLTHLRELAICSLESNQDFVRPYTLKELKEVTQAMVPSKNTSLLSTVFEREEGTIRFGRALRLLGQINNGALSEIIEKLDAVQMPNQLIRIAATIAQECEVASAKSKFVIVPTEADLKILVDDIEQYSPRNIADLLISLSFVRYSGNNEENIDPEILEV